MNATEMLAQSSPFGQAQQVQFSKQIPTIGHSLEESLRGFIRTNGERQSIPAQSRASIHFLERRLQTCPQNVRDAVEIDVRVMHGNPVFRGSRVPLYRIIEELAEGTSLEQLEEGYPSLDKLKIQAGLDFVAVLLRIYDD
ncbi:MAG: DUF433 domain-containing protein [Candidatus Acidiferrales bacterium]